MVVVLHDVDNTAVRHRDPPGHKAKDHGIAGPPIQLVLDGECDPKVALHRYGREEEGAVIDANVEDVAR